MSFALMPNSLAAVPYSRVEVALVALTPSVPVGTLQACRCCVSGLLIAVAAILRAYLAARRFQLRGLERTQVPLYFCFTIQDSGEPEQNS
jgi:hypothetical protein